MLTKTIVLISIYGLLLSVFLTQQNAAPPQKEKRTPQRQTPTHISKGFRHRTHDTLTDFQKSDFYRTIIDNNLFRPLGWTPPRFKEPYRLIGTILPRDTDTPPTAILKSTIGNTTHIVTTGEQIDARTEVIDIQLKEVTLSTNGQQCTLHLSIGF